MSSKRGLTKVFFRVYLHYVQSIVDRAPPALFHFPKRPKEDIMNKFFLTAVLAASAILAGCGSGDWFSGSRLANPEETKPPIVVALADAVAACKATPTAQVTVNGQAVAVKCGEQSPAPAAKPAARKPRPAAATQSDDGNTIAELRARLHRAELANRQAAGTVQPVTTVAHQQFVRGGISVSSAAMPHHAEVGKVYSDAYGNTYQRDEASKFCNFAVSGERQVKIAIEDTPDPAAAKAKCDLEWIKFKDSMRPTTAIGAK